MLYKLIIRFETEGTTAGYTFSSILSEMALLSDSIRNVCTQLYEKIQGIYVQKLIADGFLKESAHSIALTMTASIEGGMMLCLTPKTSKPLKMISRELQRLI